MNRCDTRAGRRRTSSGFSYVWVLFSVALVGVSLALAADCLFTSVQRERERELMFVGHQFRAALQSYSDATPAGRPLSMRYPTTLDELLHDSRWPSTRRHLRRIYIDPMTGNAEWGLVKIGDRIVGVHSLSDAAPFKQADFEPEDASLTAKAKVSEWWFTYPDNLPQRIEGQVVDLPEGPPPLQDPVGLPPSPASRSVLR